MQEDGAIPNRGTLSMMLEAYCQQGNMTGAKQVSRYKINVIRDLKKIPYH